jgi:hypothetical protein
MRRYFVTLWYNLFPQQGNKAVAEYKKSLVVNFETDATDEEIITAAQNKFSPTLNASMEIAALEEANPDWGRLRVEFAKADVLHET